MDRPASRVPIVVGAVLGAVAFVIGGLGTAPFVLGSGTALLGGLLTALLLAVAVAFATWRPSVALAVAWAGAILQMAFGLPILLPDLLILGVLFATGASRSARLRWTGLGSAIAGGIVSTAYLILPAEIGQDRDPIGPFVVTVIAMTVTLVLAWTLGLLLRTFRRSQAARVDAAAAQAVAIEEQERGRIARDMHDVVAHSLAVIVAQADGARYLASSEPSSATETLGTISGIAREALGDVRLLLERLRHQQGDLPQPGAGELHGLLRQIREAGLDVILDERDVPDRLSAASDLALYRIVQESLTNALRHGDTARPVRVAISASGDALRLEVRSALRPESEPGPPGHGLLGMRERARLAGGELVTRVEAGEFVVAAMLPTAGEIG